MSARGQVLADSIVAVLPDGAALVAVRKLEAYGPMGHSLRLGKKPLVTVDGRTGELCEPLLSAFLDGPPVRATAAPFGNAWVRVGDEANEVAWLVQPRLGVVVQWTTVDREAEGWIDCPGVAPWLPRAFPLGRPPAYVVVQGGPESGFVVPILGRTIVRGDEDRPADALVLLGEPYELVVEPDADGFFVALSDRRGAFAGHVPHGAALRVGDSILRIAYHLDDRVVWQGAFTSVPPAELADERRYISRLPANVGGALFVSVHDASVRYSAGPLGYYVNALDETGSVTLCDEILVRRRRQLLHGDTVDFPGDNRRVFRYSPHPFVEMDTPLTTTRSEASRVPSAFVARPFRAPVPSPADLVANLFSPRRPRLHEVVRAMRRWRIDVLAENVAQALWPRLTTRDLRSRWPLFKMDHERPRRFACRPLVSVGIKPNAAIAIEEVEVPELSLALALTSDPSGAETAEVLAIRAAELASGEPDVVQAIRWSVIPWRVPRGRTFPHVESFTDAAEVIAMDAALPPGVRSLAAWQLHEYDAWSRASRAPSGADPDDPPLLLLRILSLGYLVDDLRDGVLDLLAPAPDLAAEDDPTANTAGPYTQDRLTADLDVHLKKPPSLVVISPGKLLGRRYLLPQGSHVLGSAPGADILLDDPHRSVADEHARIDVNGLEMHITPLAAQETTFVNGYAKPHRQKLWPGDRIRLGDEVELELVE
ncbi:FHA domain-containing protein [Polyangium sp. 6x1]|uniref:FHA domain-containing protein n=1 Tax=Polyangium sp. 6x1 TaxID=3042689 RepID=UPI002482F0AE|nr:FHA domain-containing protein [Polyangium sp. 6x1]MDI1449806.1 FHA domain-containing protein [Polyangium sp. 6x1]